MDCPVESGNTSPLWTEGCKNTMSLPTGRTALLTLLPGGAATGSAANPSAKRSPNDAGLAAAYLRLWYGGDLHRGESVIGLERACRALETWPDHDCIADEAIEALVSEGVAVWRTTAMTGVISRRLHLTWNPEEVKAALAA